MTTPFFLTAVVILRMVASPLDVPSASSTPMVLIVTTEDLRPAFRALELWNATQGCRARVVTLGSDAAGSGVVQDLASLCRRQGVTGVLLGGDEAILPLFSGFRAGSTPGFGEGLGPRVVREQVPGVETMPSGVQVGRARVRDLEEAWAFVEACRTSGRTLDQLIAAPGQHHASDSVRTASLVQALVGALGPR